MSEQKEKIMTPDEYYQSAYNRIISIGEAIIKNMPKATYNLDTLYVFSWDKTAKYSYLHNNKFIRMSDGNEFILSKYNTIIPIGI